MMKIRKLGSIFLVTGLLAGCSTFHETGNEFKKAGSSIKEDFSKAGPAIKEDFKKVGPAMKEGFSEMGRDIQGTASEAKESLKETFK
jgi:predicted small secreted protein